MKKNEDIKTENKKTVQHVDFKRKIEVIVCNP